MNTNNLASKVILQKTKCAKTNKNILLLRVRHSQNHKTNQETIRLKSKIQIKNLKNQAQEVQKNNNNKNKLKNY